MSQEAWRPLNSLPADLHKVRFKGETGLDLMRMNRLEEAVCALLASSSGGVVAMISPHGPHVKTMRAQPSPCEGGEPLQTRDARGCGPPSSCPCLLKPSDHHP